MHHPFGRWNNYIFLWLSQFTLFLVSPQEYTRIGKLEFNDKYIFTAEHLLNETPFLSNFYTCI